MKTLQALLRDTRFSIGAAIMLVLIVLAVLSFVSPYNPQEWRQVPRDLPPSGKYLLGTSSLGQDVFWQLTAAIRNSLLLAVFAAAISRVIALTVGLVSGYAGGIIDRVLMFINDGFIVLPLLLILILLALMLQEQLSLLTMGLLFGIFGWALDARFIRSQILSLREREFTHTAILSGTPPLRLIFDEYLLFVMPLTMATLIGNMIWVTGMEVTLAYLGLTDITIPTLGTMLHYALNYQAILLGLWWWIFAPIGASVLLFVALYLLSISISEYLDPRARIQRVGVR
ncbi:MAG: Dipeptide transport system permease protein DppC [Chloroflexi bacterium ADurb.Bin325]|nr:MAG: Dipeptide transport system permease protein DppC [Chloroflexi bacterium ADurb.Bin325]